MDVHLCEEVDKLTELASSVAKPLPLLIEI